MGHYRSDFRYLSVQSELSSEMDTSSESDDTQQLGPSVERDPSNVQFEFRKIGELGECLRLGDLGSRSLTSNGPPKVNSNRGGESQCNADKSLCNFLKPSLNDFL